jgi:aerobic C4-dicarboxylate transport protein
MSEARALTNLIGNGVATIVVAKWGNDVNMQQLENGLNSVNPVDSDDYEAMMDVPRHR